jgi:hypothetical protein
VGSEPIAVEPGEVRPDSLLLGGPTMYEGIHGEPVGELEGRLRLVYEIGTCLDSRLRGAFAGMTTPGSAGQVNE